MKFILFTFISITSVFSFKANAQDALKQSIERGSGIYEDFCMACHLSYGEGLKNVYPPLAKSDYLIKNREGSIKGIKYGQEGKVVVNGITYNGYMPSPGLDDDEVADVMNYITNSWGNKNNKMITKEDVFKIKK